VVARNLQTTINNELGLPCSLGVATNKLVAKIANNIANASFEERRWLIEKLDAKATLTVEDGERIAYAECRLGEKTERLRVASYKGCLIITPGRE
jgi:hypothetical protein